MLKNAQCILFILGLSITLNSCVRQEDPTNAFITQILNENTERLYKSEIQRTRVNLNRRNGVLVYTFWKKQQFEENGTLFLHVYLEDSSKLPENRRKHGFLNLPIKASELVHLDNGYSYLIKPLSTTGEIQKLVTGQYTGKKRSWHVSAEVNKDGPFQLSRNGPYHKLNKVYAELTGLSEPYTTQNTKAAHHTAGFIAYLLELNGQKLNKGSNTANFYVSTTKKKLYTMLKNPIGNAMYAYEIIYGDDFVEQHLLNQNDFIQVGGGPKPTYFSAIDLQQNSNGVTVYKKEMGQQEKVFGFSF